MALTTFAHARKREQPSMRRVAGGSRNRSAGSRRFSSRRFSKRLYADDPAQGFPYITGADVFCISTTSTHYLIRRVAHENRLLLQSGMIVLHEAGQRYGLIGRSVMVGRTLDGFACTNNMVRLLPHVAGETGYIFAALSSEHWRSPAQARSAGSSIPHLDASRISAVKIPWPDSSIRAEIAALVHEARECWDRADELEKEADSKVELALKACRELRIMAEVIAIGQPANDAERQAMPICVIGSRRTIG